MHELCSRMNLSKKKSLIIHKVRQLEMSHQKCSKLQSTLLIIFPDLDITPKNPIGVRTTRQWLIKLGWQHTEVKKSVYMDGHEHADVVKYCQEVFLPLMARFKKIHGPLQRT